MHPAPSHTARCSHSLPPQDPFCKYDDHLLQLFTSSLFLAAAAAAMVGSWTCNRFGRKLTMLAGGACFLVGTGLVAGAGVFVTITCSEYSK